LGGPPLPSPEILRPKTSNFGAIVHNIATWSPASPERNKTSSNGKRRCKLRTLPHRQTIRFTLVHNRRKIGPEFWPAQRAAITLGIATHLMFSAFPDKKIFKPCFFVACPRNPSNLFRITFTDCHFARYFVQQFCLFVRPSVRPFVTLVHRVEMPRRKPKPSYLADDCRLVTDAGVRRLRSADTRTLVVGRTQSSFGDRTFATAAPRLWNSLLSDVRQPDLSHGQYRRSLKTFLFGQ